MTKVQQFRKAWVAVWLLGFGLCTGCVTDRLFTVRPPRLIQVGVSYLPYLVKADRPQFPSTRLLVLLPVDKREPYPTKRGALPVSQDNTTILGILGFNSDEGIVRIGPSPESYPDVVPDLGVQRRMKAGVPQDPDLPRGIFTASDVRRTVQEALASHFQEAGFLVEKTSFAAPNESGPVREPMQYALGCAIEEFSLVSLERYQQEVVYSILSPHLIERPVLGPTRAEVVLALTLYRWPGGEVLWAGKVADSVDDPPLEESEFLYATPGEVLSMALSRAVGNILVDQHLQDVLLMLPHTSSFGLTPPKIARLRNFQ
jgi:hypothetical protein